MTRLASVLIVCAIPAGAATISAPCLQWPVVLDAPTILQMQSQGYGECVMRLGDTLDGKAGTLPMCGDAVTGEAFAEVCPVASIPEFTAGRFGGLPYALPGGREVAVLTPAPVPPVVVLPTPPARPWWPRPPIIIVRPRVPVQPPVIVPPVGPSPVPLPATIWLMAGALGLLGWKARK